MADEVSPDLYAAHEAVRRALLQIMSATRHCPGCVIEEMGIVRGEIDAIIRDAAEAVGEAVEHEPGSVH